jgi:transposase
MVKSSFARLSPLAKGRIVGLREAGTKRADIVKIVKKKDGRSPSLQSVDDVLRRFGEDPEWDGLEERTAGGRPRQLTSQQVAKILQILLKDVGKHRVSSTYVKRKLPELRHILDKTI